MMELNSFDTAWKILRKLWDHLNIFTWSQSSMTTKVIWFPLKLLQQSRHICVWKSMCWPAVKYYGSEIFVILMQLIKRSILRDLILNDKSLTFHECNIQNCYKPLQKLIYLLKSTRRKTVVIYPQLLPCRCRTKTPPMIFEIISL